MKKRKLLIQILISLAFTCPLLGQVVNKRELSRFNSPQTTSISQTTSTISESLYLSHRWWKQINPNFINCNGISNTADADIINYAAKKELCLFGWINQNYTAWTSINDSLTHLQPLSYLEKISFGASPVDKTINYLVKLPYLKLLERTGGAGATDGLTNEGIKMLSGIKSLETIRFSGCSNVNDDAISALVYLPHLKELWLSFWPITDKCLPSIAKCSNLRILKLNRTGVTDAGISYLGSLPYLEDLNLEFDAITVDGIKALAQIPNLKKLNLSNTKVTDDAADLLIELIHSMEGFISLEIYGTQMSRESKQKIAENCPGVIIRF